MREKNKNNLEKIEEEKRSLKPLMPRQNDILCKVIESRVSTFGMVRVDECSYSMPDYMIKEECKIVAGPFDVKVYSKRDLVIP